MRYMVFGDVHGNLLALDTALAAARQLGADRYLCVGDLVGYGPQPLECLERVRSLQQSGHLAWVAGNHELVVRGELDLTVCNAEAAATLRWTRELVGRTPWAKEFLAKGHLTLQVDDQIWLAHDSLVNPGNGRYYHYPRQADDEIRCLRQLAGRVCFYGHTHRMRGEIFRDGRLWLVPMDAQEPPQPDPKPVTLGAQALGWIGAGSTGLPTSDGRRAEFLILDDAVPDQWKLERYAVTYPREQARECARRILTDACSPAVADRIARWM